MSSDHMQTDDIVQDVFIKLYHNLDLIRNKDSVLAWLFKSSRNELYSLYRNTKLKKLYMESEDYDEIEMEVEISLSEEIENKELNEIIMKELDNMNPDLKEVFILKEYSGLSYKEIAALIEIGEELVKSRLYKVRQKLIKKVSKLLQ